MLRENLKDAGQIIQTILKQPLAVPGLPDGMTLLDAAEDYKHGQGESAALSKVLLSFLENPGPTQILLRELEILHSDITV